MTSKRKKAAVPFQRKKKILTEEERNQMSELTQELVKVTEKLPEVGQIKILYLAKGMQFANDQSDLKVI